MPWDESSLDMPTPTPDEISAETEAAIERANGRIDTAVAYAQGDDAPTFDDLFGALDDAARDVLYAYGRGAAQRIMAGDDAVRDAAFAAQEAIEKWRSEVPGRADLAAAIERFATTADLAALSPDEQAYVRRWEKDVRLTGAVLPPDQRAEVARLTGRLIELASSFFGNVVQPPHLELTAADLEGMPEAIIANLEAGSTPDTFDVPLNNANYAAIVERCRRRDVRERALRAWTSRGVPDNLPVLEDVLATRGRIAELLGYPSWQALRTENLAAKDAAAINAFIADLADRLQPIVRREAEAMAAVLRAEDGAPDDLVLQDWDWRYADRRQREVIGVRTEELAEYLELDRVLDGLASLSAEIFGVQLVPHPERVAWDPDVRPFDMVDVASGEVTGRLFVDPYVRPGKQAGAWVDELMPGRWAPGRRPVPTLSLVTNASRPGDDPSVLTPDDVNTVFHEYGHALNFALGAGRFAAGRTEWIATDFVEGPSMFVGSWGLQPAVMSRFARHRRTGEPIPSELLDALTASSDLNIATVLLRILSQGWLDAALHGEHPISIDEANRGAARLRGLDFVEGTSFAAGLWHLVNGYDAALYGYSWSEVVRVDLLDRFEAGGLTSPAMGAAYRAAILEVPWIRDPVAAVNAFLGREWSADAFVARASRSIGP